MNEVSPGAEADTKVCPFCAETIKAAAVVCRYCGRELTPGGMASVQRPTTQAPAQPPAPQAIRAKAYEPAVAVVEEKKSGGVAGFFSGCLWVIGLLVVLAAGAILFRSCFFGSGTSGMRSTSLTPAPSPTPTLTIAQMRQAAISPEYDDLARNTERYTGKLVQFSGTVAQVMEVDSGAQLRVNVGEGFDDIIFVQYPGYGMARVLDGDKVDVVGWLDGRVTYETVLGNEVTLPAMTALALDVVRE